MKRIARLATFVLGISGAAFSQAQQGQLDDKYGAANLKASYLAGSKLAREEYATCMADPLRSGLTIVCQLKLNSAAFYEGMAAAVTEGGTVPLATNQHLLAQLKMADMKVSNLRSAQLARQQYDSCKRNPNASASSCQSFLASAQMYELEASTYPPLPK